MRYLLLTFAILSSVAANAQHYKKLHFKATLVDTHNDVLSTVIDKKLKLDDDLKGKTNSDLKRFKEGGVDVQIFSVWCDGLQKNPFAWANREMDTLIAVVNRNPDKIVMVGNPAELKRAVREKKLAAMFGVEGGHMIENDLSRLDSLYKRGTRYMTITWNNSTDWATSALDETTKADSLKHKGLTDFGKQVIRRMNELGMLVDLSHVGEQTFWDAINTTTKPVLVSHSNSYALCPFRRNLKDDQIMAVGRNGGVIHLNFFSGFIDSNFMRRSEAFDRRHKAERDSLLKINPEPYWSDNYLFEKYKDEVQAMRPTIGMLIDHLDHIVKLIGVDHVGMGSDFDGVNSLPLQLDDVTAYPLITEELVKRGYSDKDIKKILGGNFIRLLEAQN